MFRLRALLLRLVGFSSRFLTQNDAYLFTNESVYFTHYSDTFDDVPCLVQVTVYSSGSKVCL